MGKSKLVICNAGGHVNYDDNEGRVATINESNLSDKERMVFNMMPSFRKVEESKPDVKQAEEMKSMLRLI